jgi:hypothetical protein
MLCISWCWNWLILFVPCILSGVYIIMYVSFTEQSSHQCLNCLMVCCSALLEGILHVCLPKRHPVLLFLSWLCIKVLCIAISYILWKMHSLAHCKSFAGSGTCCIYTDSAIQLLLSCWLVEYWQVLESRELIVSVIEGNVYIWVGCFKGL